MIVPTWTQLARRAWNALRLRFTRMPFECSACGWPVTKVPGKRGYWQCVPCLEAQKAERDAVAITNEELRVAKVARRAARLLGEEHTVGPDSHLLTHADLNAAMKVAYADGFMVTNEPRYGISVMGAASNIEITNVRIHNSKGWSSC